MSNKNKGPTLYFSQFGGERPIPEQFIAAMDRAEERTKVPLDEKLPELSDEIIEARFDTRYENTNEKWLVVVKKKKGVVGPLLDFRTTDQGQTVQVSSIMFRTSDETFVRERANLTQDVAIKDLGNGWAIQEVAIMGTFVGDVFTPGIFQGIELTTRKDDPLPAWMRIGAKETIVQEVVPGTVTQPDLVGNDLSASERQLALTRKLTTRLTREEIALPSTQRFVKQLEDILPVKFRGLLATYRTSIAVAGVAAEPTLQPGELIRSEEQITVAVKLVEILSRAGVTFPIEITESATITEYGGGLVNIITRIDVVGTLTPEEGEQFVSSRVTKLGEGHEMRETVVRVASEWPTRRFARWIPRLQTFVTGTKRILGINTGIVGAVGSTVKEVVEVDGYREEQVISDQTTLLTALDAYVRVLHNNTNVHVPPQLVSIESRYTKGGDVGSYTENGSYNLSATRSVGSLQLRGSAQASASIIPEVAPIVKIPRTQNIPCKHVLLYVSNTATRAAIIALVNVAIGSPTPALAEWPDFRPQQMLVLLKGGKANGKLDISASAHDSIVTDFNGVIKYDGYSRTNGSGVSVDISSISRLVQIPETIHTTISSVGGDGASDSISYGATGYIHCNAASSDPTISGVATAVGSVEILSGGAATLGNPTIPATGQFLHRLVTEPDSEFNRVRVFAEVVDFADIYV